MLTVDDLNAIKQLIDEAVTRKEFYTVEQASKLLSLSKSSIYKLTFRNELTYYKPGGKRIFFSQESLQNFIQRNKIPSKTELMDQDIVHFKKKKL